MASAPARRFTVFADGGMLLDLDIGGQKPIFKPAPELGKTKTAEGGRKLPPPSEAAPGGAERERADEERPAAASGKKRPGDSIRDGGVRRRVNNEPAWRRVRSSQPWRGSRATRRLLASAARGGIEANESQRLRLSLNSQTGR